MEGLADPALSTKHARPRGSQGTAQIAKKLHFVFNDPNQLEAVMTDRRARSTDRKAANLTPPQKRHCNCSSVNVGNRNLCPLASVGMAAQALLARNEAAIDFLGAYIGGKLADTMY
eukprot:1160247-Pelagomonas_calceolata.AAC.25